MKSSLPVNLAAIAGILALSGCMSMPANQQSSSMKNMAMSDTEMKSMCNKYTTLTPSEQKAMMAIHTKDMSSEMRDARMKQMAECK